MNNTVLFIYNDNTLFFNSKLNAHGNYFILVDLYLIYKLAITSYK